MKYFIYARKSTDEPERQILSIEAQIEELREFASREKLEVVKTYIESQTAKNPGRPIFNEMLSEIEKGKAEGILAWHPDRLARNSMDGGKIIYLIDASKMQSLKFPTFWFEDTPQGKFMLNIAFGQSKYYVDSLSENVKRGLRQKARKGEASGVAPTGYLNNRLTKKIVKDPERFDLIIKLFRLYATGKHSLKETRKRITKRGLTSRRNKPLSTSNIQMILKNPFYYGAFLSNGELYQGTHPPAISKKLFDKVQAILKDKSRPKKRSEKIYAFRGLLKCGECGCAITSEMQKGHTYYRCTKKRIPCSQKYIREEGLDEEIKNALQKVSLPDNWKNELTKELEKEKREDERAGFAFSQNLKAQIKECNAKLDKLLDNQLEGIITKEEYVERKNRLLNKKIELSQRLKSFEKKNCSWLELANRFILEANQVQNVINGDDLQEKARILQKAGSNLVLMDSKIKYFPREPWEILGNLPVLEAEPRSGEAYNIAPDTSMLGGMDSNHRSGFQRPVSYH